MKINVAELLKAVGNRTRVNTAEKMAFPKEELALKSPVKIDILLTNTGRGILLEGSIAGSVQLNCNRCLKDFVQDIEAEISELYKKARKHKIADKEEIGPSEAALVFPIDDQNLIDIDEAIRQNLILAIPIKTICHQSCKGITA